MSEELDPSQELTSWEEVSYSNMVHNEVLLRLLVKKDIQFNGKWMQTISSVKTFI